MTIEQLINHISFDLEESVLEVFRKGDEIFNSSESNKYEITLDEVLQKKIKTDFFVHKDTKHYGNKDVLSVNII